METPVTQALRLAHEIEELLEGTSQSTRIARAMAASLVDELEAMNRGARTTNVS